MPKSGPLGRVKIHRLLLLCKPAAGHSHHSNKTSLGKVQDVKSCSEPVFLFFVCLFVCLFVCFCCCCFCCSNWSFFPNKILSQLSCDRLGQCVVLVVALVVAGSGVGGGSVALVMGGGSAWCRWWQCCTGNGWW